MSLNARTKSAFQTMAVEMFDSLESEAIAWAIQAPPTVQFDDDSETAGQEYACRVLPGDDAKERDVGSGVNVGDTSYHLLASGLDVTPEPGWRLLKDGADIGRFSRVDTDAAEAQHRCWIERV